MGANPCAKTIMPKNKGLKFNSWFTSGKVENLPTAVAEQKWTDLLYYINKKGKAYVKVGNKRPITAKKFWDKYGKEETIIN